ncbi:MAG: potassium-transporting ATPase subunit B, partial [Planctomycetaceae bacterium]|nr:potassium-transporting ATPase subunit B [Planctomycetaceae bacterium]
MTKTSTKLFDAKILGEAIQASFRKLDPRVQLRNPVMFAVYLGSILTTLLWFDSLSRTTVESAESSTFVLGVAIWLWFTVLFANFAEALAEGHGKAQAATLRNARTDAMAFRLTDRKPVSPEGM